MENGANPNANIKNKDKNMADGVWSSLHVVTASSEFDYIKFNLLKLLIDYGGNIHLKVKLNNGER